MCRLLVRRPSPLLFSSFFSSYFRIFETFESLAEHCFLLWFYSECVSLGFFFSKVTAAEVTWLKEFEILFVFLKQVAGLHKEKQGNVIHNTQKPATKYTKEKICMCETISVWLIFCIFVSFNLFSLKSGCLIFRYLGLVVLEVWKKQNSATSLGDCLINNDL